MIRLQGRKTVTFRLCKALVTNPHVLLAEVASDSASKPIVGPYSQSVPVSVHQDRIGQAAIQLSSCNDWTGIRLRIRSSYVHGAWAYPDEKTRCNALATKLGRD